VFLHGKYFVYCVVINYKTFRIFGKNYFTIITQQDTHGSTVAVELHGVEK